ncbi:PIN domain-containing protein [Phyllobacterium zundukense]|jgi:predicted nucleic acid-binding protein|uniref:PIN domain-containing protein n=1 Tax=Phyllobacterium zundukense TaxID=1867719 RepID=A0ACD4D250_9HYPH|nr:PIN domain-containing protein [Phyllobacterium zundukense]UXN59896.1 PIN domain-containing protein [Phyllobacterium zundukense]
MPAEFLDTNVLIYAFTDDPRRIRSQELLAEGCTIGVQVLNEFTNVARRKLGMDWEEIREALASICTLCPKIVSMDVNVHEEAIAIAERHGFQIFDALMIASAILSGCDVLWSEDMRDGLVIENRLRIVNPFRLA